MRHELTIAAINALTWDESESEPPLLKVREGVSGLTGLYMLPSSSSESYSGAERLSPVVAMRRGV